MCGNKQDGIFTKPKSSSIPKFIQGYRLKVTCGGEVDNCQSDSSVNVTEHHILGERKQQLDKDAEENF